ncbi:MAG: hypothetical protein AAFQ92_18145 [Bacteroidota bacterium]
MTELLAFHLKWIFPAIVQVVLIYRYYQMRQAYNYDVRWDFLSDFEILGTVVFNVVFVLVWGGIFWW